MTPGSLVKTFPQLLANQVDAVRAGCVEPGIDRSQRRTAGTQNQEAVHEAIHRHCRRLGRTAKRAAGFRERTLDVIHRQRGAAFRIAMEIPGGVVKRKDLEPLVESGSTNSSRSNVETEYVHIQDLW